VRARVRSCTYRAFKCSTSVLKASNHYPKTRPISFCVMPLVCAHSIYPTWNTRVIPVDTCVSPRRLLSCCYTLSDDGPYIRHLHLFFSPTLRHCRLSPHPNLKSLGTRCAVLESLSILHGTYSPEDELSY
jgi:hypothetical protein